MPDPGSPARVEGHPIHAMLVPFPIAFFVATFLCDMAFWRTGNAGWVLGSVWLLSAGLVMAGLAAATGVMDVVGEPRFRALREAWWHAGGNLLVVLVEFVNLVHRVNDGAAAILPAGMILSAAAVALLMVTGWMGRQMVYGHHVGVSDVPGRSEHVGLRPAANEKAEPSWRA